MLVGKFMYKSKIGLLTILVEKLKFIKKNLLELLLSYDIV